MGVVTTVDRFGSSTLRRNVGGATRPVGLGIADDDEAGGGAGGRTGGGAAVAGFSEILGGDSGWSFSGSSFVTDSTTAVSASTAAA